MAEAAKQEDFTLPGDPPEPATVTKEAEEDQSDLEIVVIDDTAPEDQDRDGRDQEVEAFDPDSDEFKDEVKNYSERAQKRISQMRYEFHEERRGREAAEKQNEEAIRFAQQVGQENDRLKTVLNTGNQALLEQANARTDAELAQARDEFKAAHESGNTDDLLASQEKINKILIERQKYQDMGAQAPAPTGQPAAAATTMGQAPAAKPLDPKTIKWMRDNPWFGAEGHEDMTAFAYGVHEKLVKEKVDPRSDEYFNQVNSRMQTTFPEFFGKGEGSGGNGKDTTPAPTSRKKSVVAPSTRSGGKPPRRVELTATQVSLAKRLGLTVEQYARQHAKEEMAQDG